MARPGARLAGVVSASALAMLFLAPPAAAEVSQVSGGAIGFSASVSLFGGPANKAGPAPTVTLPSGGGPPVKASEQQTEARFGPAVIFSSGAITVSTEGSLGATGSATSSTDIQNVNRSASEVFTAQRLQSSCKATETEASGSTTVAGGTLITAENNIDDDNDDTKVTIPNNPAPNTEHQGTIETVGDRFRAVFNEQIPQAGGVTVNAYHLYLLGPTAVGEVIVGQSRCGVNTGGGSSGGGDGGGSSGGGGGSAASGGGAGSGSSGGSGASGAGAGSGSSGGGSNMPKTGIDVLPLTVVGSEMVAGGVAAVIWAGRRRRWPRR